MIKPEGGLVAIKLRKSDIKSNNNSSFQQLDDDDQGEDTLNFYAVSILASINVGVCLFEAVAPVRNNDMRLLLLQLLYGEKINDLMVETGHTHVSGHIEVLQSQNLHLSCFHQTTWCMSYHQFLCFFVENDKGSFIATVVANSNLEPAVQEMKYQPYSSMTSVMVAVQKKLAS
ncbi:hypothetical protein Bca101_058978 [Brassica carinata]